jgi:hypothetical protein
VLDELAHGSVAHARGARAAVALLGEVALWVVAEDEALAVGALW